MERRVPTVERFVRLIVAGGVAFVAGLWIVTLFEAWSGPWIGGVAFVLLGGASLLAGIGSEIEVR